ncbi:MAG TPA: VWA domain-containing protein [Candidatus Angelobacter sp.]|nr:VWA domain-containing protein [Candidatus Angelobacter sp.]
MHLRNKRVVGVLSFLLLVSASFLGTQGQPNQPQSHGGNQTVQATPLPPDVDPNDPALPVWARPATPPPSANKPAATGNVPAAQPGKAPEQPISEGSVGEVTKDAKGEFTYRSLVNEVTLSATVLDLRHHLVTNLDRDNFVVYEDGQPQNITSFIRKDIPVSIGIVVDNSGSMRTKRAALTKAVLNLIQASNPQDEVFVVNFNDDPYLDQDFTNKVDLLHEAMDRVDSRGGTALYDAVIASADHLAKGAKREKKALLVVTDGVDNESRESLESAIRAVQSDSGPTIYAIGILGDEPGVKRAKRALQSLSDQTGGVAFFPKDLEEVDEISQEVARDIRNQYSITYKPTNPRSNGGYRKVRVEAHASGYKDLQVRTRDGYFADEKHTAAKQ